MFYCIFYVELCFLNTIQIFKSYYEKFKRTLFDNSKQSMSNYKYNHSTSRQSNKLLKFIHHYAKQLHNFIVDQLLGQMD